MFFELKRDSKTLALIPALWLAFDFLPVWFILTMTALLAVTSFFKTNKYLAYLNFILIFFIFKSVGMYVNPETMVPCLAVFILAQLMLNKISDNNEFYLIFLWLGAFALFSSTLYYLLYSFVVLIILFILDDAQSSISLKNIVLSLWRYKRQFFIISSITVILFIFFPRFYNFLPTANVIPQGKIGYAKEINNSSAGNLRLSSQPAFYAQLDNTLAPELLYWRGRVLGVTDGYNWRKGTPPTQQIQTSQTQGFIRAKMKYEQNFNGDLILLNTPYDILETNLAYYADRITNTFTTYTKNKKTLLTASSYLTADFKINLKEKLKEYYLTLPKDQPPELINIFRIVNAKKPKELIENFKRFIIDQKFEYTLSPGPLPSMASFINKKKGFCTHYASLLANILRYHGTPARLVSGFQGGQYNETGGFYLIKSNDAHAWVEYFNQGRWHTIDPTGFVSPDRINLGGEQFLTSGISLQEEQQNSFFSRSFYIFKQYLDTLNYKVSLFLDNYDRTQQKNLSRSLNLNRRIFYILGFVLLIAIITLLFLFNRMRTKRSLHPADKLMRPLEKKLKCRIFPTRTIASLYQYEVSFQNTEQYRQLVKCYQQMRYGFEDKTREIKSLLKDLN